MKTRRLANSIILLTLCHCCWQSVPADENPSRQSQVDKIVAPFIEQEKLVGVMVGLLGPDGQREFFSYGVTAKDRPAPDKHTLFEIGSITKTFTGLLLAIAVERGEVRLDQPVRELLPDSWKVPQRGERELTLLELATHSSGLPENPPSLVRALVLNPKLQLNPFAEFDKQRLADCLAEVKLKDKVAPPVSYSNLGMGLLGDALALRAGKSYGELVRERIAAPLKLADTLVVASDEQQARTAVGHDGRGEVVPYWSFAALDGAGALRSTADDMLTYLAAQCGQLDSPLKGAIAASQVKRSPAFGVMHIGLAWLIRNHRGQDVYWHNGGTNCFTSFAAYCQQPRVALVVLSNSGPDDSPAQHTDTIGDKLIRLMVDGGAK